MNSFLSALRRRVHSLLVVVAAIAVHGAPIRAQQALAAPVTTVIGRVGVPWGGIDGAIVELMRDSIVLRATQTHAAGTFEFESVAVGDYQLRVRRIGYRVVSRRVILSGRRDTVDVQLVEARDAVDSLNRLSYQKLLAARTGPRHWDCSVSPELVRDMARRFFEAFGGTDPHGMYEVARKVGMKPKWEDFRRDFRPITDQRECTRLGDALNRRNGLLSDELQYFRVGRAYVSTLIDGSPIIVGLDGQLITALIVPS